MQKIQTIVWDWNGTLLNDVELCRHTINRLLRKRGRSPLDLEQYRRVFQFPIIAYYRKLGFDFSVEPFEELAHEYMAYYQPRSTRCALQADALDVLTRFQRAGLHQVLLSASRLDLLHAQLAHYPLSGRFEQVLGISDVYAHSKEALAKRFVQTSHRPPDSILFIGDSVHDHEVAMAAHCRCVLVACGHEHKEKLLRCGCETVDHLRELPALLGIVPEVG